MRPGRFSKYAKTGLILFLFFTQSAFFFVIPSLGASMFLSPDETANAVSARAFAAQGRMKIVDAVLKDGPWLRPRSFVTQGDAMVPVGFLGLPIALGLLSKLFSGLVLLFFVPLLVLSACFPIWKFLERSGRASQITAVTTWLSFPTVILYANRGLFANLPVVCVTIWSAYLLWDRRAARSSVLSGLLFGFAVAMRPTEIVWMIAWIICAWLLRQNATRGERRHIAIFAGASLLPMIGAALVAWRTYGSPFSIGYFLRDSVTSLVAGTGQAQGLPLRENVWPFGFHPRAMWFNVKNYIFGLWLPWTIVGVAAAAASWKKKTSKTFVAVAVWTVFALVLLYGQSIYQDHVGVNVVSSGNSFLRYLLPLSAIFAISAGWLAGAILERFKSRRTLVIVAVFALMLAYAGTGLAMGHDDEGVVASSVELQRYASIRASAYQRFGPQTIILSERSDKIFFPTFRVASPLPSKQDILSLVENAPATIALFSTTLDEDGIAPWTSAGLDLRPVFVNDNQTMYVLSPLVSSTSP